MAKRGPFVHPRFILTEGIEDAAFVQALIHGRQLRPFDVSAVVECGVVQGNTGFQDAVTACELITNFAQVTDVVIVTDNDTNPQGALTSTCNQIARAKAAGLTRRWVTPVAAGARVAGDPSVAVWMWPAAAQHGCLETLLWQAIMRAYPNEAACADQACNCAGANGWPIGKLDKARVRCFISIAHRQNPAMPLHILWRDAPSLIPIADPGFDPFATFLAAL